MKKFGLFAILMVSLLLCSCAKDYGDDISKLYGEVEALKAEIGQINTNIGSLQTVLNASQSQDYVTSVSKITQDGAEIGYTIQFKNSGTVTIYHGKDGAPGKDGNDGNDGQPGKNGKDGDTPVIGVSKYIDGQWYWTLNGSWLKDETGEMVCANGKAGDDGKNGITPQLKIDDGFWYITYNEGTVWNVIGPATGEAGASGDAMFQGVNTGNEDYVIFTLIDGNQIKIPTWSAFSALKELCDTMNENLTSMQEIVGEIQKGGYIKMVRTIYDDDNVETGYMLLFSDDKIITIHHGKDGATPAIGVRQHTDGVWYWTLNGEWLKDESGDMVCARGQNGSDGQSGGAGQSGAAGKDGVTPQLKIEDGYWNISYDNGATWTQLGKATGENGTSGDSMFKAIDVSNDQYVSLTLADDSQIKVQRFAALQIELSEKDGISIEPGKTKEISYTITGTCAKPKVSVASVGGWLASVNRTSDTEGTIRVTAPVPFVEGTVTVLVNGDSQSAMEIMTFVGPEIVDLGLEMVDLGLSVKWATFNVGATRPEEYGDYYAWGEIEPYYENGYAQEEPQAHWKAGKSGGYAWTSYKWCNGTADSMTKYNSDSSYGTVDDKTVLDLSDDVARQKWGGNWRMPTYAEMMELMNECTWTETDNYNGTGVAGRIVTSNISGYTDKSIFLPAAGYRPDGILESVGSIGKYWSSSRSGTRSATFSFFEPDLAITSGKNYRTYGLSVRPVIE